MTSKGKAKAKESVIPSDDELPDDELPEVSKCIFPLQLVNFMADECYRIISEIMTSKGKAKAESDSADGADGESCASSTLEQELDEASLSDASLES